MSILCSPVLTPPEKGVDPTYSLSIKMSAEQGFELIVKFACPVVEIANCTPTNITNTTATIIGTM